MTPPNINQRARKILQAVVSEYLQTGDAVGSRTVTRKRGIGLSPATVRNVMADLEDLGLLAQPHTSAGRVPTATGLRFFIDSLLKVRSLSLQEKQEIRARCGVQALDLGEVVQRASKTLSDVTQYTGIVMAPQLGLQRFKHIEFVGMREGRFLCILVTTEGQIENRLIEVGVDIDETRLTRIHNYLNELLTGLTLKEMRQRVLEALGEAKNSYDEMVSSALLLSKAALEKTAQPAKVVVSGQANLLESAKGSGEEWERLRDLLQALEDKELLVRMLDESMDAGGIQVFLSGESADQALSDVSVVATSYGPSDRPIGAIAVIGPRRMNYGKVMSVVDFTADLVSRIMGDF